MALALTEHPKYITTSGYGCIFSNYGLGPETPEEPTIITKFFGKYERYNDSDTNVPDKYYREEKIINKAIIDRCGNFPTLQSIFGIDLTPSPKRIVVSGYKNDIVVKHSGIIRKDIALSDVAPRTICERPNHHDQKLRTKVYSVVHSSKQVYPVIKMNNLGVELYETPKNLNLHSFIQSLELLALLHIGVVHNDIKGNNMLISPLTRKVSLIDFGLSKPFDILSSNPPYHERSYPNLRRSWFAYPPEYTFLSEDRTYFLDPTIKLTEEYIREYKGASSASNIFLEHLGEDDASKVRRVQSMLHKIYLEYFDPSLGTPKSKLFLETAITGDTYTLGLEQAYLYGTRPRDDGVWGDVERTRVSIGPIEITSSDFLQRISTLLTALNPKYRPYHINIIKFFKHYNKKHISGATTFIKIEGQEEPYAELSILNGTPPIITASPGMALGSVGCPISRNDIENNLKLLYFLIQNSPIFINRIIYNLEKTYINILDDANKFIMKHPSALFQEVRSEIRIREPLVPVSSDMPKPEIVSGLTLRLPKPKGEQAFTHALPVTPPSPIPGPTRAVRYVPVGHPAPYNMMMNYKSVKIDALRKGGSRKLQGRRTRKRYSGGQQQELYIGITNIVKNLVYSGLLALGTYMAISHDDIRNSIHIGGRTVILNPSNIESTYKKLNSSKLKVRSSSEIGLKEMVPNYSDLQKNVFINEIITSTIAGKINILYEYYIKYLSIDNQKSILNLLFFIPLANSEIVKEIVEKLSTTSINDLIELLTKLKNIKSSIIEKEVNLNMSTSGISAIVDDYINTTDRYMMIFDVFDKIDI